MALPRVALRLAAGQQIQGREAVALNELTTEIQKRGLDQAGPDSSRPMIFLARWGRFRPSELEKSIAQTKPAGTSSRQLESSWK
jgi:hypothetical protein